MQKITAARLFSRLCLTPLLAALAFALTGCPDTGRDCDKGQVLVQNESGGGVEVTFEPISMSMDAHGSVSVSLSDDPVIGEVVELEEGSYRVWAVMEGTDTVVYDSGLRGSSLTISGCGDLATVTIPRPEPEAECVAGGRLGPWATITPQPLTDMHPLQCSHSQIVMEARDRCGNLLPVDAIAAWARPAGPATLDDSGPASHFISGRATATLYSPSPTVANVTVTAEGLTSPVVQVGFVPSLDPVIVYLQPSFVRSVASDYVILCVGGYPTPPRVEAIVANNCGSPIVPTAPLTVTVRSAESIFPPTEVLLTHENGGRAGFPYPNPPASLATDTLTAEAPGVISPPLNMAFDRDCAASGI